MIPLFPGEAEAALQKRVRTDPHGVPKLQETLKIGRLDEFAEGTAAYDLWRDKATNNLSKLTDFYFDGMRRYDVETDTLFSVNTAVPTPLLIGMPSEVVQGAIAENATRQGYSVETYKGLVDLGRKLEPKEKRRG